MINKQATVVLELDLPGYSIPIQVQLKMEFADNADFCIKEAVKQWAKPVTETNNTLCVANRSIAEVLNLHNYSLDAEQLEELDTKVEEKLSGIDGFKVISVNPTYSK